MNFYKLIAEKMFMLNTRLQHNTMKVGHCKIFAENIKRLKQYLYFWKIYRNTYRFKKRIEIKNCRMKQWKLLLRNPKNTNFQIKALIRIIYKKQ